MQMQNGQLTEVAGTEQHWPADLVLLAMGFTGPRPELLAQLGVATDARGNAQASTDAAHGYATSVPRVFAAGDMRRGQSLIVWADPRRPPKRRAFPGRPVPDRLHLMGVGDGSEQGNHSNSAACERS